MNHVFAADMDADLLVELKDIMGSDFGMLVDSWQRDSSTRLEAMQAAAKAGDAGELKQLAHSLKGSSANLGAQGVVALCIEVEACAGAGDVDAAAARLGHLAEAVSAAERSLLGLIENPS